MPQVQALRKDNDVHKQPAVKYRADLGLGTPDAPPHEKSNSQALQAEAEVSV